MFMSCREFRGELIEIARGAAMPAKVAAHMEGCGGCRRFLAEQEALSAAEAHLAAVPLPECHEIGARVMAEFDQARKSRAAKLRALPWIAGLAAAAWLIATAVTPSAQVAPARQAVAEAPFVPIPYTVPLAPEENATVVRMAIPVRSLIAVGYRVGTVDPRAVVHADVLVSEDGRVRAIRPLSISNSN